VFDCAAHRWGAASITVQVEAYAHLGARVVSDIYPGKGSLGGMFSGLKAAQTQHALVVACDMPFLNLALLEYLISLSSRADVILPRAIDPSSKFGPTHVPHDRTAPFAQMQDLHLTHAIYAKSCLDPMQNCLLRNNLRMISFFNQVSVQVVEASRVDQFDPQHLSFFNVNTPEDLQIAHSLTG
jgi:molybdenum cofactor guanylyltransferase